MNGLCVFVQVECTRKGAEVPCSIYTDVRLETCHTYE